MILPADEIRALSTLARSLGLALLEVSDAGWSLRIVPAGQGVPNTRPEPPQSVPALSPGVGTFLPTHPDRQAPFQSEGDAVTAGTVLGLVASGTACRAVLAPCAGAVGRCLQPAGVLVGFGTALFDIVPARKDQT